MTTADEFALLPENAAEAGLAWRGRPMVRRESVDLPGGTTVSALMWGNAAPEVVLLHGGGQNAHTWDTVALALDRPLVAVDLPGHGHSSWRDDHRYTPEVLASDVTAALRQLAPGRTPLVGMSLGGLTALRLAVDSPESVARLALVDITPGTNAAKAEPILAFLSGPERFSGFQEILERTIAFNPTRSVSSLRRGVIHNAREFPDGSWGWRWDPAARWRSQTAGPAASPSTEGRPTSDVPSFSPLWSAVDDIAVPVLLIRGGRSSVVTDDDVAELRRRKPEAEVVTVPDAGHSIQGDQPLALARLISAFIDA